MYVVLSGYLSASPWKVELPDYLLEHLEKILNLQTYARFYFELGTRAPRSQTSLSLKLWETFRTPLSLSELPGPLLHSVVQVKSSITKNLSTLPSTAPASKACGMQSQ